MTNQLNRVYFGLESTWADSHASTQEIHSLLELQAIYPVLADVLTIMAGEEDSKLELTLGLNHLVITWAYVDDLPMLGGVLPHSSPIDHDYTRFTWYREDEQVNLQFAYGLDTVNFS